MSARYAMSSDDAGEQFAREVQGEHEDGHEIDCGGYRTASDHVEQALMQGHAVLGPATITLSQWQPSAPAAMGEDAAQRAGRIKATCRIEDVVRSYGVALTAVGGGRRYVGLCPFHTEEHASFTVYPETQSFCCYGCHAAGDVITFVCHLKGVAFDEALRLLGEVQATAFAAQRVPRRGTLDCPDRHEQWVGDSRNRHADAPSPLALLALPESGSAGQTSLDEQPSREHYGAFGEQVLELDQIRHRSARAPVPGNVTAVRLTLLSVTTALAMQGLARAPLALTYLGERGISYTLAQRCRLGYLEEATLAEYLAGDTELEYLAQDIGLLNRFGNGALTRRLVVPEIRQSRTTQLIGRMVPGARTPMPGVKYYLVCGAREKGLLGYGAALERLAHGSRQNVQQSGRREPQQKGHDLLGILVLEGALDYVVAVGWDLPVLPVALLSAYPSRAQIRELLDLQARSGGLPFLLLLDADGAGRQGTEKFVSMLRARHAPFQVLTPLPRLPLPEAAYKDLGELGPLGQDGRRHLLAALGETLAHGDAEESNGRP